MKVWAVANQKGGVGKTTTAVTLGGHLAHLKKQTLLVDLDPHGSLSSYFGFDPETITHSVYSLFQVDKIKSVDRPREVIQRTEFDFLDLLPASTAQATLDRQLGNQDGKGLVISKVLQALADSYEHVIIDCPPMLGVLLVNALAACEHLVVPVQTEFLALKGLERMMRTLEMMQKARQEKLRYTIVPTMYDRRTRASVQTIKTLRERYGDELWHSLIPIDTRFREASEAGVPLSLSNHWARGSLAYGRLLAYLQEEPYALQANAG